MNTPSSVQPPSSSPDEVLSTIRQLLAKLMRSEAFERGDAAGAISQVTEAFSGVLGVERASVWKFDESRQALACLDLYERGPKRHSAGHTLHAKDTPRYFAALAGERSIAAHDARTDPRTSEFEADYLRPHGIVAMLDAPVLVEGHLVGVVCNEHVGERRKWQPWEELVAGTFADLVGMVLLGAERAAQGRALAEYRAGLEELVAERTARLQQSEENFRHLFEAAPIGLVLSRLSDSQVVAANPSAAELFGVPLDEVAGQIGTAFWVDESDRQRLVSEVRDRGRVDSFEVRLRRKGGKAFWADVAVRLIVEGGETSLLFGVRDITLQKRAVEAAETSRKALHTIFDAAPLPMVLTGLDDGIVRYCNKRAADMFEMTLEEILGHRSPDLFENDEDRRVFVERLSAEGAIDGFAVRLRTKRERGFWALLSAKTLSVDGERLYMVGFADLTEQKRIEEGLRELAATDPLTGTWNRRRLFEIAEEEVQRSERYARPLCVAMLDLDHFKGVNDRFGHAVGDEAIRLVARAIRGTIRRQDEIGRYGGEELMIVCPETELDEAAIVIERARAATSDLTLMHEGERVPLTLSAGVVARGKGEPLREVVRRADAALYQAKTEGRNRVVLGRSQVP